MELRKNGLKTCFGLKNLPNLKELYIAENQLTTLRGLENLESLYKINARANKIEKVKHLPQIPSLTYLNLRENAIQDIKVISYIPKYFPKIEYISFTANPFADDKGEDFKQEVLILIMKDARYLRMVNKSEITNEERDEAEKEKIKREIEAEEARKAAEEEARKAAEEG